VVAEGVEDGATLQRLREYDCDLVQGYWVSKPLGLDELVVFLGAWKGELARRDR
jgi:EAL domain-containing protein (putative c-di-GMP-specific phosphodiesterase class I)